MAELHEPPFNPDDDTNPSLVMRPQELNNRIASNRPVGWQRTAGILSLIGATVLTLVSIGMLLFPQTEPDTLQIVEPTTILQAATGISIPTEMPTLQPTEMLSAQPEISQAGDLPVIAPEQLAPLLQKPVEASGQTVVAYRYDPYTVVRGNRPRSEFLEYSAIQGDTINEVAERYNLQPESLAWCNDRRIIQVLRPNDVLRIPPVDGACHRVLGTREETIAEIARQYQVDNPYDIIDSLYNYPRLVGITPDDILPGGTNIFIPGGQGEAITWNPGVDTTVNADGSIRTVNFAPGQPGSCGAIEPSGGTYWSNPLPNGTWVRGFYAGHTGIDLSAASGTPIHAANGGRVIFAGWNRWGYGNTVVIEHGGVLSTLYGHMSSVSVGCGQFVNSGDVIGAVGSTGNSSGPHLHFEIRSVDAPMNPSGTPGVGW